MSRRTGVANLGSAEGKGISIKAMLDLRAALAERGIDLRPPLPPGYAFHVLPPKTTYKPIPSLSYCATHDNTQDAGEWVDESGDECCESWFDQDDPARCVMCDVYAKVPVDD